MPVAPLLKEWIMYKHTFRDIRAGLYLLLPIVLSHLALPFEVRPCGRADEAPLSPPD